MKDKLFPLFTFAVLFVLALTLILSFIQFYGSYRALVEKDGGYLIFLMTMSMISLVLIIIIGGILFYKMMKRRKSTTKDEEEEGTEMKTVKKSKRVKTPRKVAPKGPEVEEEVIEQQRYSKGLKQPYAF